MTRLEEARRLLEADSKFTLQTYNQLLELWRQAEGAEVAQIGILIEGFILEAPLDLVVELCKGDSRLPRSGWGIK